MTTDMQRMTDEELVERLGGEFCPREDKHAAVTDEGGCLICGRGWVECLHDEIQVIAWLRRRLERYGDLLLAAPHPRHSTAYGRSQWSKQVAAVLAAIPPKEPRR